jgi:type III secretory pathway component EscR
MRERSIPCLEEEMKLLQEQKLKCAAALVLGCVMAAPQAVIAQDHVVSPGQIQNDVASSSAERQQNEQQLRSFLSRKEIQQAMKSEGVNPQQVTNAVSQLNDNDLASLAARSQKAQRDFAAGRLGLGIFTLIGIVVVAVILIAVFA